MDRAIMCSPKVYQCEYSSVVSLLLLLSTIIGAPKKACTGGKVATRANRYPKEVFILLTGRILVLFDDDDDDDDDGMFRKNDSPFHASSVFFFLYDSRASQCIICDRSVCPSSHTLFIPPIQKFVPLFSSNLFFDFLLPFDRVCIILSAALHTIPSPS